MFYLHEMNSTHSAQEIAQTHYENFPVGSVLFPKHIRNDIFNIYAFSRTADDIVDDPSTSVRKKHEQLEEFRAEFLAKSGHIYSFFPDVWKTIENHHLTERYFLDLLTAFQQDIDQQSYETLDDIVAYAHYSANPVGRLMLELFGFHKRELLSLSDKICSGLQFINFWQDLSVDKKMNRFYVPKQLLSLHGLSLDEFYFLDKNDSEKQMVLNELFHWTEKNYMEGYDLFTFLNGRFKYEIKLTWLGGYEILQRSKKLGTSLLTTRPKLKKIDYIKLILKLFL